MGRHYSRVMTQNEILKNLASGVSEYFIQKHDAERAGEHYDLRVGGPDGLQSWALPKGLAKPGETRLAIPQSVHPYSYGSFEGVLEKGRGKGTVSLADKGKVRVAKGDDGSLTMTFPDGSVHRFVPLKSGNALDIAK